MTDPSGAESPDSEATDAGVADSGVTASDLSAAPASGDQPAPLQTRTSWLTRHPVAAYTLGRIALFVIPLLLLMPFADPFLAILVAFLISAIASIFVLRPQREAMSASIASRADRASQKMAERTASEDAWDDANRNDSH